jgi:hypothetical protein
MLFVLGLFSYQFWFQIRINKFFIVYRVEVPLILRFCYNIFICHQNKLKTTSVNKQYIDYIFVTYFHVFMMTCVRACTNSVNIFSVKI